MIDESSKSVRFDPKTTGGLNICANLHTFPEQISEYKMKPCSTFLFHFIKAQSKSLQRGMSLKYSENTEKSNKFPNFQPF